MKREALHAVVMSRADTTAAAAPTAVLALVQNFAEFGVVHVFADVVDADVSVWAGGDRKLGTFGTFGKLGNWGARDENGEFERAYLCKLSGRGYLCSRSGQKGQMYPGDSWTRPCLIISFFLLKPFPPSERLHSGTGQ